jgi:hypothetical protein
MELGDRLHNIRRLKIMLADLLREVDKTDTTRCSDLLVVKAAIIHLAPHCQLLLDRAMEQLDPNQGRLDSY